MTLDSELTGYSAIGLSRSWANETKLRSKITVPISPWLRSMGRSRSTRMIEARSGHS